MLVVSPHPDDETLGAGGLIGHQVSCGLPVTVVAVTDGEAAYLNCQGLAETRTREQEQAVKVLGVDSEIIRLRLPDSAVSAHESDLRRLLTPLIERDMLIVAPWISDWHPDHEACARVAQQLCEQAGADLIFYVFWTWHRRTPEVFDGAKVLRFELTSALQAAKQAALECHRSQLERAPGDEILPRLLLAPALRPFETFIGHG